MEKIQSEEQSRVISFNMNLIGEKLLIALGKLTAVYSYMELRLRLLCVTLVGKVELDNAMDILTSEYSLKQLIRVTQSLLTERNLYTENVEKLTKSVDKLGEERNTIMHSTYGTEAGWEEDGRKTIQIKLKNREGELKRKANEITEEYVLDLTDRMNKCASELLDLSITILEGRVVNGK